MDPSELSKRLTATFGAAAVICYACGYLSLRARSFALGTEPAYQLVDQVYVFNGAKFALSVLFALILTSPIIILVSWIGRRLAERVSIRVLGALEWLAAGTMLGLALISFSLVVWPAGVLLEAGLRLGTPEDPNIVQLALERAVLGEARSLALLLFCAVIVLTATASIWQVRRSTSFTRHLDFVLAAMVALLAFLLPMYHGAFLADRKVRVLSEVPEGTAALQAPVAVVDRTAEQIALFGLDSTGDEIVVTIDSMALNGVPVSTVESLGEFIWRIKHSRNASAISHAESFDDEIIFAQLSERESDAIGLRDLAGQNVGFFTIVTDFFGMLLQNANALGGHDEAGELWTVDLDPLGKPSNRRRVGSLEDIMWPVVGRDGQPLVVRNPAPRAV